MSYVLIIHVSFFKQTGEQESPGAYDDSSHLRNILLEAVDRTHDCDSESTVTVNSEARMISPVSLLMVHF